MAKRLSNILITNTVALNGGDAAILLGEMEVLQKAFGEGFETVAYDSNPEVAQRYYRALSFRKLLYGHLRRGQRLRHLLPVQGAQRAFSHLLKGFHRFRFRRALQLWRQGRKEAIRWILTSGERRDLQHYSEADLVVSTGGTYLTQSYGLESRLYDFEVSLALDKPLVFFTQSVGALAGSKYHRRLRAIFNEARLVLLRDEQSRQNVLDLGVSPSHVHVSADAAFALADPTVLEDGATRPVPMGEQLRVAISVRRWRHFSTCSADEGMQRYKEAIRTTVRYLVEQHDAQVTFLSTCQGIPEYHRDDSQVAVDIACGLPESVRTHVRVDRNFHHPTELIHQLQTYDCTLSTRMHHAILALCAGTPVLSIAYEFKTKALFERLKMDEWICDIETLTGMSLSKKMEAFVERLPATRAKLFPGPVQRERERAYEAAMLLKNIVRCAKANEGPS